MAIAWPPDGRTALMLTNPPLWDARGYIACHVVSTMASGVSGLRHERRHADRLLDDLSALAVQAAPPIQQASSEERLVHIRTQTLGAFCSSLLLVDRWALASRPVVLDCFLPWPRLLAATYAASLAAAPLPESLKVHARAYCRACTVRRVSTLTNCWGKRNYGFERYFVTTPLGQDNRDARI